MSTSQEKSVSFYDELLAIVKRDLAAHGKCPHCGWTPAEQDALSRDANEALFLRDLLRRFVKAWEGGGENIDRLCEIARNEGRI